MQSPILYVVFFIFFITHLRAEEFKKPFSNSSWPAAITFLVADYKYSEKKGVKVCEVQQGSLSAFTLGRYAKDGTCITSEKFVDTFKKWGLHCWFKENGISDEILHRLLGQQEQWTKVTTFYNFAQHPLYIEASAHPIYDPSDISQYHGIVFGKRSAVKQLLHNRKLYPGMIILDEPTFPYWIDKLKMGLVFKNNPALKKIKPIWNVYKKRNPKSIYKKILKEIPGEYVVIKPRKNFKSKGILLVHKAELYNIIDLIITKPSSLSKESDSDLRHWAKDSCQSFLVEEFIESDPIYAENGKLYDATYRTTFILAYEKEQITLHYLDTYLKYPLKSLEEEGTFADKHKSHTKVMEKGTIPLETLEKIKQHLSEPLQIMFEEILSR